MDTDVQATVFKRDGQQCVAPWLGATDRCATLGGFMPRAGQRSDFEIDHVRYPHGMATKGAPQGGYGKRPPNDPVHLVTLCHRHHQDGWATASRYGLRVYLLWQALRDRADTAAAVIDQLREIGNVDNYSDLASDLRALAEERP